MSALTKYTLLIRDPKIKRLYTEAHYRTVLKIGIFLLVLRLLLLIYTFIILSMGTTSTAYKDKRYILSSVVFFGQTIVVIIIPFSRGVYIEWAISLWLIL